MRNIFKSTPPSFRRRENAAAIVKAPPPGALTKGSDRKFPGLHPPLGGATSPSLPTNRRFAFPILALLAALAAGLLFLLPGGLLQAQDDGTIEYAENGMDPVATYTGLDPEGRPVYWSLLENRVDSSVAAIMVDDGPLTGADVVDHEDFTISSDGVLSFKFSPDFETPEGAMALADGAAGKTNAYKIVVVASDNALGAGTTENPIRMTYKKVTVTVTDVDDNGMVTISAQQPQQGVALNTAGTIEPTDDVAAALKDQDASLDQITAAKWKWEQSSAMDGPWTLISGATAASYTPAMDVVGMYLRVTATYEDDHGDKTVMAVSAHPARAKPAGENASPVFPGPGDTTNREVDENSPPGTAVGKPVKAGDAGDILTYSLSGTDDGYFAIDRATGQITVKKKLNFELELNANCAAGVGLACVVTVTATDPWGITTPDATTVSAVPRVVNITIKGVNEAPRFTVGPTRDKQEENEDTIVDDTGVIDIPTLAYAVTDADNTDADIKWSLMGADKDAFEIEKDADPALGAASRATVMFKKSPNYEDPADTNMDNMYMVTVVATDAKKLTAMRDVVITVTNVNDPGMITLSSVQPKVGIAFKATLKDEDGGVEDEKVKWRWYNDTIEGQNLDTNAIAKATSDTYTPKNTDAADGGVTLSVRAAYTDTLGSTSTMATAANDVVVNQENRAPEFKLNDKVISATTRMVAENTDAISTDDDDDADDPADNIGTALMATDRSGITDDTLTYTLGGRDAAMFRVRSDTGFIEVGTDTELDYETKNSYMVTVTATDPSLASATIDVTINVIDVNEPPEIAGEDDLTKEFRENSISTIQTFSATDVERRPVYWSLRTNDGDPYPATGSLTISSRGALSFKAKPDYETPGEDAGEDAQDNTYTVRVVASDDAPGVGTPIMSSFKTFNVRVTNAIEQEQITVSPTFAQVNGGTLTASLTDGDVTEANRNEADWEWSGAVEGTAQDAATVPISAPATAGTIDIKVTYPALGKDRTKTKRISVQSAPDTNNDFLNSRIPMRQ